MAECEVLERDGGDPDKEGAHERQEADYESHGAPIGHDV